MRGILFSIPQGLGLVSDFTCQVFFFPLPVLFLFEKIVCQMMGTNRVGIPKHLRLYG